MLVGERMAHPIISVGPDMPIQDALNMMRREKIRRAPVIHDGKLLGIVTNHDLLHAAPSAATTLSVWELNYLLSKVTVGEVMIRPVLTVTEDTPIEDAARIMADNNVGGLPVMRGDHVVGIITETNLFKVFLEILGAREKGIRITLLPKQPGVIARLTEAIICASGSIIAFGTLAETDSSSSMVICKIGGLDLAQVRKLIGPVSEWVVDVREC